MLVLLRHRNTFFYDYPIVIFAFTGLYVLVPMIAMDFGAIPALYLFSASEAAVEELRFFSSYFIIVISLFTLVRLAFADIGNFRSFSEVTTDLKIPRGSIWILFLFVFLQLIIFLVKVPSNDLLWSDRIMASSFKQSFNSTYKTQLMSLIFSYFLLLEVIRTKKAQYLLLLCPFIYMDLHTGDRTFLFQCAMIWVLGKMFLKKAIPIGFLTTFVVVMIGYEFLRGFMAGWEINVSYLLPGELTNSYISNLIIIDSGQTVSGLPLVASIILPDVFVQKTYSQNFDFKDIIIEFSTLSYGLGGSILAQGLALEGNFWRFLYPILLGGYGLLIAFLYRALPLKEAVACYVIAYFTTHSVFRAGAFAAIDLLVYYFLIILVVSWLLKLLPTKYVSGLR